ncbi:MAG TPA: hypothetical protein VEY70_01520 [Metabacillus sp.]|nr:hypothetical protein [Metabacillus sp.]
MNDTKTVAIRFSCIVCSEEWDVWDVDDIPYAAQQELSIYADLFVICEDCHEENHLTHEHHGRLVFSLQEMNSP